MEAQVLQLNGMKYAILPYDAYEKMVEILEDARDIADAREIASRIARGEGEYFPSEVVNAILNGENKIKVFREYRGLTQEALAEKINKSVAMIRKLENGSSDGSISTIKAISDALKVDVEMLI